MSDPQSPELCQLHKANSSAGLRGLHSSARGDLTVKPSGAVSYFGVRHHSPGCARSLKCALAQLQPDMILIEGPPEANGRLHEVIAEGMEPPVALLISPRRSDLQRSTFPFAEYSPEWVALKYAAHHAIEVRMIDAPLGVQCLERRCTHSSDDTPRHAGDVTTHGSDTVRDEIPTSLSDELTQAQEILANPLAYLALREGYLNERDWWNQWVERPAAHISLFSRLESQMTELRAYTESLYDRLSDAPKYLACLESADHRARELRREAYMRLKIREASRRFKRVAVVCGAWHVPALRTRHSVKTDRALISGARRVPVEVSWVPWSDELLTLQSGYGAGVYAPSWYHLLWHGHERPDLSERALCAGADALRSDGYQISSASVIDAVELARALSDLRKHRWIELKDLIDAGRVTLCRGESSLAQALTRRLCIGDRYGHVPVSLISVSLVRDFHDQRRRLRIKLNTHEHYELRLNLTRARDREKSVLIHRAMLLGLFHACPPQTPRLDCTAERWSLLWSPQDEVQLSSNGRRGATVAEAAQHALIEQIEACTTLDTLIPLINLGLASELVTPVWRALDRVEYLADAQRDVSETLRLINALVHASGQRVSLRGVALDQVTSLVPSAPPPESQHVRSLADLCNQATCALMAQLPRALAQLDPCLSARTLGEVASLLYQVHDAIERWGDEDLTSAWIQMLRRSLGDSVCPPVVDGRLTRCAARAQGALTGIVHDVLNDRLQRLTLKPLEQWLIGLIASESRTLDVDSGLLKTLDTWLATLSEVQFLSVLPLLRRAFSTCERRANEICATALLELWGDPSIPLQPAALTLSQELWSDHKRGQHHKRSLFDLTHRLFT